MFTGNVYWLFKGRRGVVPYGLRISCGKEQKVMDFSKDVLRYDEQAIMRLRALYRQFGYALYRMSRFEEYELYAENKAFLTSGDIITFSGASGKLMALRPDVTLSIVKNTKDDGGLKKLYYNENVYRPDGHEFKEQMQVGLECIGHIDVYSMSEVLMLASRSLETLGERSCLDISHMGFINGIFRDEDITTEHRAEIFKRISARNAHELSKLCKEYSISEATKNCIVTLATLYGPIDKTISELKRLSINEETDQALCEIENIRSTLNKLGICADINLDFSIVNDLSYYSGLIFKGYIDGITKKVLSGGRYDKLLGKFGKSSGAIGFAVYLDLLESLTPPRPGTNIDVMLLYGDNTDMEALASAVRTVIAEGLSICVQRSLPEDIKYGQVIEM